MDHVTGHLPSFRDKLLATAADTGVLPSDPLGPLFENLAGLPDDVERRIEERIAPLLDEVVALRKSMERGAGAIEQAAARPLMTTRQIHLDVLPTLVAAVDTTRAVIIALLLIGAAGLGWFGCWMQQPVTQCCMTMDSKSYYFRNMGVAPQSAPLPPTPGSH